MALVAPMLGEGSSRGQMSQSCSTDCDAWSTALLQAVCMPISACLLAPRKLLTLWLNDTCHMKEQMVRSHAQLPLALQRSKLSALLVLQNLGVKNTIEHLCGEHRSLAGIRGGLQHHTTPHTHTITPAPGANCPLHRQTMARCACACVPVCK